MIRRTRGRMRLCVCLIAGNLALIWGNSLLPGELSGAISGWVRDLLWFLFPQGGPLEDDGEGLLRKLAHFSEFCLLGALLCWLFAMLQKKNWAFLLPSFGCGCLTACADEAIQSFVPGRCPSWRDVAIDASGVALALLLFSLGWMIHKHKKEKNQQNIGGNTK